MAAPRCPTVTARTRAVSPSQATSSSAPVIERRSACAGTASPRGVPTTIRPVAAPAATPGPGAPRLPRALGVRRPGGGARGGALRAGRDRPRRQRRILDDREQRAALDAIALLDGDLRDAPDHR